MGTPAIHVFRVALTSGAPYELRCWGEFALIDTVDGRNCAPRSRKARAIIAYLALLEGAATNRERMAGMLWGERGDGRARGSLRQALSELRAFTRHDRRLLLLEGDQISLVPTMLTSDIARIEASVRAGDFDQLLHLFPRSGDRLFSGLDGLDPAFDDWLASERLQQHERLVLLGLAAAERGLRGGEGAAVQALASRLQLFDDTNETVARVGMRADYEMGDVGGVRHRYERLRDALGSDLDLLPSRETERMLHDLTVPTEGQGSRERR